MGSDGISRRQALATAGVASLAGLAASANVAHAQAKDAKDEQSEAEHRAAKQKYRQTEAPGWRHAGAFSDGQSVASFLNVRPAQGPGEAMVSYRPDGRIDVWIYL